MQSLTVFVGDVEAHFANTKAEGARIVEELQETIGSARSTRGIAILKCGEQRSRTFLNKRGIVVTSANPVPIRSGSPPRG